MTDSIVTQSHAREAIVSTSPDGLPYCLTITLFGKIYAAQYVRQQLTPAEKRANYATGRELRKAGAA